MNVQIPRLLSKAVIIFIALMVVGITAASGGEPFAYVTNSGSDTVSVFDKNGGLVYDQNGQPLIIKVKDRPQFIAITPDGASAYVAEANGGIYGKTDDSVAVIDTSSNNVVARFTVGDIPHAIAISPDGSRAYITNKDSDDLRVYDTTTYDQIGVAIPAGYRTAGVVLSSDGAFAYVAAEHGHELAKIATSNNTVKLRKSVSPYYYPQWLAIAPDDGHLYVPFRGSHSVGIYGTDDLALVHSIKVRPNPKAVVMNQEGTRAYVTNAGANTVSVLDTSSETIGEHSKIADIVVGNGPQVPAITPDGRYLWVPNAGSHSVSVIDLTLVGSEIDPVVHTLTDGVGLGPWGVAFKSPPYVCDGFYAPMDAGAVSVKKNRALPLKARLFDDEGTLITDQDIQAPPVLQVTFTPETGPAADVTDAALSAGWGTEGNVFEFDLDQWRYNLKVSNYTGAGTYTIEMMPGAHYHFSPSCVASFVIK